MDSISPSVITSRLATREFNDISAKHSQVLKDMVDQRARVQSQNDSRDAASAQQQAAYEKSQNEKIGLEQKQQELNIKRMTSI